MDPLIVFISFSADGTGFAQSLHARLRAETPYMTSWIYTDRRLGYSFYDELEMALRQTDVLVFVLTRDSVSSKWCKREMLYADQTGKRVIPLIVHPDAGFPVLLQGLEPIDCTAGLDEAWGRLRAKLDELNEPEARLRVLREKLRLKEDELARAREPYRRGFENQRATLVEQIREAEQRISDPQAALRRQDEEIRLGQARERAGETEPVESKGRLRCVNHPPAMARNIFRNRDAQIRFLQERLRDPKVRIVAITGPSGIGKTAMIAQWREILRSDDADPPIDAFVYLAAFGPQPIRAGVLLDELRKAVLDKESRSRLEAELNDPAHTVSDKLEEVLHALTGPTVVVVDDAEALLDSAGRIRDPELAEVVDTLLHSGDHHVKMVLLSREVPRQLPGMIRRPLDKGLPPDDARSFLRALDEDGACGLRAAPDEHLTRVWQLTDGSPRALEAVSVILREGRVPSLMELLDGLESLDSGRDVLGFLVGQVFDGLESTDQRILQVLAAYQRPVLPAAVDFVLKSYLPGYMSEPALRRLAGRQLIRQYGERFYLPPSPDGEFVLNGIPPGSHDDDDRDAVPVTRLAMCRLAARYFNGTRRRNVRTIDDLNAEFAEIDLLMRAGDLRAAYELIDAVDRRHLSRWGYSGALAFWRQELTGKLGDQVDEINNLVALANAKRQQGYQRQAISLLEAAQERAGSPPYPHAQLNVDIALGTVREEHGLIGAASGSYTRAREAARAQGLFLHEIMAAEGLALCLGATGRFEEAAGLLCESIERMAEEGPDRQVRTQLHLNLAWVLTQRGLTEEALRHVEEGQALVPPADYILQGHLFGVEAHALIIDGDSDRALEAAGKAAAIAAQTRHLRLSYEANSSLAVAHLCGRRLEEARDAADTAAHHGRELRAAKAFAVKGIVAFRQGDNGTAREAFLEAQLRAHMLRERDRDAFEALDMEGLVLQGLTLCGGPDLSDVALAAYRAARRITCARGVRRRSVLLLDKLMMDAPAADYAEIRRAADGR